MVKRVAQAKLPQQASQPKSRIRISAQWTPTMEHRADIKGRQVKCLIATDGHRWMGSYDRLPSVVRRRLAASVFNICPACMVLDAVRIAGRMPTIAVYLAVIEAIERKLLQSSNVTVVTVLATMF
jgi:hypothetical protein